MYFGYEVHGLLKTSRFRASGQGLDTPEGVHV